VYDTPTTVPGMYEGDSSVVRSKDVLTSPVMSTCADPELRLPLPGSEGSPLGRLGRDVGRLGRAVGRLGRAVGSAGVVGVDPPPPPQATSPRASRKEAAAIPIRVPRTVHLQSRSTRGGAY